MSEVTIKDIIETLTMFPNDCIVESFKCTVDAPNGVLYNICINKSGKISSSED